MLVLLVGILLGLGIAIGFKERGHALFGPKTLSPAALEKIEEENVINKMDEQEKIIQEDHAQPYNYENPNSNTSSHVD